MRREKKSPPTPTPAFTEPLLIKVPLPAVEAPLKLVAPGTVKPLLLINVPLTALEVSKNAVPPALSNWSQLLIKVPLPALE